MPSPLQIFIDARGIRPGMTGIGRFTLEMTRSLAQLAGSAEAGPLAVRAAALPDSIPALARDASLSSVEWVPFSVDYRSHPAGDLGLRFQMPRLVRKDEIYFAPAYIMPGGRQPFARAAMIHDAGAFRRPGDYPWRFAAYLRWAIRRTVARADMLVVPTRHVAEELIALFPGCAPRVRIVPEAPATAEIEGWSSISDDPRWAARPAAPYFLSVGTLERRKDPVTAARALERLNGDGAGIRWLWIGGRGHRGGALSREIEALPSAARFHWAGYQDRERIAEAMASATALVYPSLDEGFGLPPLEAMAAGLPAIVSDHPALREVCGEAALYFPPGDPAALGLALRQVAGDARLRERLIEAGRRRVAEFTWRRAATIAVEAFREAAAPRA